MIALRRHELPSALVSCFAFLLITFAALPSAAQQIDPKSSSPKTTTTSPAATPAATASPQQTPAVDSSSGGDGTEIINADLITLTVTVTDTFGRYITGLSKTAFTVTDEKAPQEITFFSDEDAPVSVGVIFDVSGSMSGEKVARARQALNRFFDTSHEMDEYFLIGFNSRAKLLLDKTRDSNQVLDKLMFIETKGETALYDAVYLGIEKVSRGAHDKRALIVLSDGQDNNSRYTFSELRRLLKESNVLVYGIGILGGGDAGSSLGMGGQALMDEISSVSGGKAFFPNTTAEMNEIFERIAIELRHQYSIGYRPSNFTPNGKWHNLKVKVKPPRGMPKLFVRSKDGYYATAKEK